MGFTQLTFSSREKIENLTKNLSKTKITKYLRNNSVLLSTPRSAAAAGVSSGFENKVKFDSRGKLENFPIVENSVDEKLWKLSKSEEST